ncbi:DUF4258 domain-containing protein [Danxiaibacter flavus]|uniref:DUF4258 domain-containing protein n=1 Tax=Danxiaibacter flavus TaxID=3049108 RepID=A0ABV3ZFW5_9BACT|nr:DUF4258 domain-containing protein [Chitinophagaceae bacterium DXS]
MNTKKVLPLMLLVVLALITVFIRKCTNPAKPDKPATVTDGGDYNSRGLNREPTAINYSKHARCRMECRHIDEAEVIDILHNGKINYRKSDLKAAECKKRYAVEGYSKDNQHLRIIFAPCHTEITVVTCIDLGKEWECACGEPAEMNEQ